MARGRKFGTVKVRFREVATARLHSATPLKTKKVIVLLIDLTSRVMVEDKLSEVAII